MSVKIKFKSMCSPKYRAMGIKENEVITVEEEEVQRIKSNGYNVEVVETAKPKKKSSKKKEKK